MDRLTEKMLNFNKGVGSLMIMLFWGTLFGAFILWALVQIGIVTNWHKPETIIAVWLISIFVSYKLKKLY